MIFHVVGDLHMAFSLEQHNETPPKASKLPGSSDTTCASWDLFLFGFGFKPLFLLPLMICPVVVDKLKAIIGSAVHPGIASQHPGPAVHHAHTLVSRLEETGGGMSPFPEHNGEMHCVLSSGQSGDHNCPYSAL